MKQPRIAIVCDWLTNWGGAERVILAMHRLWPEAPIYTSLYNAKKVPGFEDADVRTSFLQKIPGAKSHHQRHLVQMPGAFESFDLSEFDVVVSSSHSCAKGIITKPETLHVSYCHSPPRYLWDGAHQYVKEYPLPGLIKNTVLPSFLHDLRIWDRAAADRVDHYVANSHFVARRIKKYYQREAEVIHPPVDLVDFEPTKKEDFYVAVGRLIPYKRFDLVVEAFNALKKPLKIIGVGNQMKSLMKQAGSRVEFLGKVSEDDLQNYYRRARGLIFPQIEDFGIVPLEAMAQGTPVIAYAQGGALETVEDGVSGHYFHEQSASALQEAVIAFEKMDFDPSQVRAQAEKFAPDEFARQLSDEVNRAWLHWNS